jgi:hypothetical protein
MRVVKVAAVLCLVFAVGACALTLGVEPQKPGLARNFAAATKQKKPLSEIDLSKIGHIAPKGRVQDKHYNHLEVVEDLIANGKESIPFLINKVDDETVIDHQVEDYWPEITVGDVALLILSSLSLDATWTNQTIPGTSWEELFEAEMSADVSFLEYYQTQIGEHGRNRVKAKWEKIWATYKDRIVWDDQERCFKLG